MSATEKSRKARLLVPAAKAKPSPAIGQALGQLGVNMMQFCKAFNAQTTNFVEEAPLRVAFTAHPDKSFDFVPLSPKSTWFIKEATGIHTGAHAPNKEEVGVIHVKQLYHIMKVKKSLDPQLAKVPEESYCKSLAATCGSMGVAIDRSPRPHVAKRSPPPRRAAAPERGKKSKKK